MTETAKERIYREALEKTRDRLDGFEELYANKEVYSAFDELTGLVEKGLSQASKIPASTDKLSVEKLQEQLNTAKKALTEISEDVPKPPKYNLNAEFWRTQWSEASGAHLMEYLRAEKLKKDNEILKKALTEISELSDPLDNDTLMSVVANVAGKALAAIGWYGCPVGAVGKNGLTKEEIEGSGDE